MNYIIYEYGGIKIDNDKKEIIEESLNVFLRNLASKYLFSLDGYFKAVKKNIDCIYSIPIYFSNDLFLIPLAGYRSKRTILLNYFSIKVIEYVDKEIFVIFQDGIKIKINVSEKAFKHILKKANMVLDYKSKIDNHI